MYAALCCCPKSLPLFHYAKRQAIGRIFKSLKESLRLERHCVRGFRQIRLHVLMSILAFQAKLLAHVRAGSLDQVRRYHLRFDGASNTRSSPREREGQPVSEAATWAPPARDRMLGSSLRATAPTVRLSADVAGSISLCRGSFRDFATLPLSCAEWIAGGISGSDTFPADTTITMSNLRAKSSSTSAQWQLSPPRCRVYPRARSRG